MGANPNTGWGDGSSLVVHSVNSACLSWRMRAKCQQCGQNARLQHALCLASLLLRQCAILRETSEWHTRIAADVRELLDTNQGFHATPSDRTQPISTSEKNQATWMHIGMYIHIYRRIAVHAHTASHVFTCAHTHTYLQFFGSTQLSAAGESALAK